MVAEMLSQEEINALLGSMSLDETSAEVQSDTPTVLTDEEVDALGEIGNISMGTAATTLFTLLNHKVMITTPKVETKSWEQFKDTITDDLIAVSVDYTEGFLGSNLLILKEDDVKVIADLMMGGTGAYSEGPVTELHLSAIAESMNQMIGSSSTSMSQIFDKKIDISPPKAVQMGHEIDLEKIFGPKGDIAKISFKLQIEENIIDSELMQILPISFAKDLIAGLLHHDSAENLAKEPEIIHKEEIKPVEQQIVQEPMMQTTPPMQDSVQMQVPPIQQQVPPIEQYEERPAINSQAIKRDVDVQTPQFQSFDTKKMVYPKENMDLLMDVSLEVSVELGRTNRKIKEILEFGPGTIVELNRLVGEPVDVLVNSKFVAKGEVVVIDENFGIRITDIINPEDRI